MTKKEKELIEKIKQEMPEFTGTKVEIEKKIAMFIYLYLGKEKVFDEQYFLGNSKLKELTQKKNKKIGIDEIIDKKRVVCLTLSRLYQRLLNDFGINANHSIILNSQDHTNNTINFSDKTCITVDLQRDLTNIQTHRKISHFGDEKEYGNKYSVSLSDEEIHNLLKECGYVKSENEYMDAKIESFKNENKDCPPDELLQKIINDKELNNYQDDIGYIELYSYYSYLIGMIQPLFDKKDINYFNCYVKKNDENGKEYRDYTMCIYSVYKDELKAYLYSKKDKCFIPTSLEKIDNLEKNGFFLGRIPTENGVGLLRKYISKEKAKKYVNPSDKVDMAKYYF